MFNLDQAIAEWRRQMVAGGIKSSEALEELESHLREDVDLRIRSGVNAQQAFEAALQRIGQTDALTAEYKKVSTRKWALLRRLKALIARSSVPFPLLTHFNPTARQTLEFARLEAEGFHHDFIGTEHVLLGLLKSQSLVLTNILRRLGLEHESIKLEIEKLIGAGVATGAASAIPYTPRARKALQLAATEARTLNHACVRAEHIFLGLLLEGGGVASLVLKNLGVQVQRTREEILREMDG